MDVEFII